VRKNSLGKGPEKGRENWDSSRDQAEIMIQSPSKGKPRESFANQVHVLERACQGAKST